MGPPHGCEPQSPALPQASAGFERVCPPVFQNALGAAPAGTPGPVLGFSRHRRHTISPLPQASARLGSALRRGSAGTRRAERGTRSGAGRVAALGGDPGHHIGVRGRAGGEGRPLSPPRGRSRGPSLRSLRPAETRPGRASRPPPTPFRGDPTPTPPSARRPRDPACRPPALGLRRGCRCGPTSQPGRPWRAETPRRTGELGAGRGQRRPAPWGSKQTGWGYSAHQPPPSAA